MQLSYIVYLEKIKHPFVKTLTSCRCISTLYIYTSTWQIKIEMADYRTLFMHIYYRFLDVFVFWQHCRLCVKLKRKTNKRFVGAIFSILFLCTRTPKKVTFKPSSFQLVNGERNIYYCNCIVLFNIALFLLYFACENSQNSTNCDHTLIFKF